MPAIQSKRWCFTINNYDETIIPGIRALCSDGVLDYAVCGREVGQGTGTHHVQGFCVFRTKRSLGGVKKYAVFSRAHLEISRGTIEENIAYCSKDGNFEEFGTKPSQGRRTDLDKIKRDLDAGVDIAEIASEHFNLYLQYGRQFAAYKDLRVPDRSSPTAGYWFYGPTGAGKSRRAYGIGKQLGKVYFAPDSDLKWFDGYCQEETVIVDDINPDSKPGLGLLLRLLDRYPMRVPIKGGFVKFTADRVIFTSNYHMKDLYGSFQNFPALERRCKVRFFE